MNRALKWLAVAGCVTVLAVVAGRMHFVRAAEEGPAYDRASEGGDAASRLDQIIEKLDRVVDRMQAERMGPPDRPPRADMPPEVREMIEKRMQEGRKRMEQAREKFQELEERVKKLEAEIERLKAA